MDLAMFTSAYAIEPKADSVTAPASGVPPAEELYQSLSSAWASQDWERAIHLIARLRGIEPANEALADRLYVAHVNWAYRFLDDGLPQKAKVQFEMALLIYPEGQEALAGLQNIAELAQAPTPAQLPAPATPRPTAQPQPTEDAYLVKPPNWPPGWAWPPKAPQ